jgi:ATP-binding cassette subfamily B protein
VPLAFRDLIDFGFGKGAPANGGLLGALSLNGHFIALFGLASVSGRWPWRRVFTRFRGSASGPRRTCAAPSMRGCSGNHRNFFETLQTGEVLSRLTGDTTLIQTVVGSSISMGLRSLFQFVGGMVMLAVTSFYLFSLNLGLMALLILPIIAIGRKVKKLSRESQDKIADASALAGEILNAMPTVQAYTQEPAEARRFTERTKPVSSPRSSAPVCGRRSPR